MPPAPQTPSFVDRWLVPGWRHSWRAISVASGIALSILSAIQAQVLPIVAPLFTPQQFALVSGVLGLVVVVGRNLRQGLLDLNSPTGKREDAAPQEPQA